MSNYNRDVLDMVARCRRIGWEVETPPANRGVRWTYRICPPGTAKKIELHGTPRNGTAEMNKRWADLNAHGFAEAEAKWEARNKRSKDAKLAAEREKAEQDAQRIAAEAAKADQQQLLRARAAGPYAGPQPIDLDWFMTPTRFPETRWVIVDAAAAQKVLDAINTRNRRRSQGRVDYFVRVINSGGLGQTHQGIACDWNAVFQDGQSRFEAIVITGKPQVMQATVGMDPENFNKIDTGQNRTAAQNARLDGEDEPETLTKAVAMLLRIQEFGSRAHVATARIPNDEIKNAKDNVYGDELRAAVTTAKLIKHNVRRANAAGLATAIYLVRHTMPVDDPRVVEFFDHLLTGNAPEGSYPWTLRQKLINGNSTTGRAFPQWAVAALVIKAWNYTHTGSKKELTFRGKVESFPFHVFLPPKPMMMADAEVTVEPESVAVAA